MTIRTHLEIPVKKIIVKFYNSIRDRKILTTNVSHKIFLHINCIEALNFYKSTQVSIAIGSAVYRIG